MNPETKIVRSVLAWAKTSPLVCALVRVQTGTFFINGRVIQGAATGTPDLLGFCRHGRVIALEVKSAAGTVTEAQEAFLRDVQVSGGIAAVVRSARAADAAVARACAAHGGRLS